MITFVKRISVLIRAGNAHTQVIRYALAGIVTAMVYSALYLAQVWSVFPNERAVMAVPLAFVVTLIVGFQLHSRWSFSGHGTRDNSGHQQVKFLVVHSGGFALNSAFTWLLTAWLGAPEWSPLIPSVTITPVASFALQRQWVFA